MNAENTPKRNQNILAVFLATDDALQGILGLHIYTAAIHGLTMNSIDRAGKDQEVQLRITHEWARPMSLTKFLSEMEDSFEFMHCRTILLSIVANFEIALRRFRKLMWDEGHIGLRGANYTEPDYKPLLRWAFQLVRNSTCGSESMLKQLPKTCGDVDNARRLRNLSLHNNNKFNDTYVQDVISDAGVEAQFERNYMSSVQNREPVFLTNLRIEELGYSHVELLHILHNTIQRKFYGCTQDYNYAAEGKTPELYRMVSGRHDVGV
jgi:hypothetical protein